MSGGDWAVAALAVVGRGSKPIFTKCFFSPLDVLNDPCVLTSMLFSVAPADELQLQFLMHSSLDICDEKLAAKPSQSSNANSFDSGSPQPAAGAHRSTPGTDSRFLDKLLQTSKWTAHGFHSCTSIRIILVTMGEAPREAVHPLCRHVYETVSTALCNPFRDLDDSLEGNAKFRKLIDSILYQFSATARSKIAA